MKTTTHIASRFIVNILTIVALAFTVPAIAQPPVAPVLLRSGNNLRAEASAKLASFTGRAANGAYQLAWETVLEENVRQYEIEYSTNNRDFERAGIVSAANKNIYAYSHTVNTRPAMYYRLKIVDIDGSSAYSNTINVINAAARNEDFVSPTIIRDGVLNVTLNNNYKNLQVFNSAGIEVFREYVGDRSGNRIGFNLPNLPAGPYYVKLIGSGIAMTSRVMIM